MLEHFHHLHRQWATKAQFLLACLNKIETADVGEVTGERRTNEHTADLVEG